MFIRQSKEDDRHYFRHDEKLYIVFFNLHNVHSKFKNFVHTIWYIFTVLGSKTLLTFIVVKIVLLLNLFVFYYVRFYLNEIRYSYWLLDHSN